MGMNVKLLRREVIADGTYLKVVWEITGFGLDRQFAAHFRVWRSEPNVVLSLSGCYDVHEGSPHTMSREETERVMKYAVGFKDEDW